MNLNAAEAHHHDRDDDHGHDQPAADEGMSKAEKDEAQRLRPAGIWFVNHRDWACQ